ncbi:MAG TPA: hypothetical protein VFP84_20340 [Kofleriaceae bacterium]|nr:hypothetical protein [Kofleriaceae bacterium]
MRTPAPPVGLALGFFALACGGSSDHPGAAPHDAAIVVDSPLADAPPAGDAAAPSPDAANPTAPATLADTGLCLDAACTQITGAARAYAPRFPLWIDGATKRRWIALPPGTQIDTRDPDHWVFPVGTRFWKEITRDGVRVETRYMIKRLADDEADGAWFFVSFAWNASQDATTPVTVGAQNVNGTPHDIPSVAECRACHDSLRPGHVLGFQAIQLDFDGNLDALARLGWLSQPLPPAVGGAHYPLPADATPAQQAALGYFHANCGHCHNPSSLVHATTPMVLRLDAAALAAGSSVTATPLYTTTTNATGLPLDENGATYTKIIVPRDPAHSILNVRVNSTNPSHHMPKLGSELTDPAASQHALDWINAL